MMDASAHGAGADEAWQQRVQLRLRPDPRLSPAQQAVVAADYGMSNGELAIETRGCLVPYVLQRLQLDPAREKAAPPTAQQVVIANPDAMRRWLFHG